MSWIMTIAAGVALGYFLVQYFTKNTRAGQETEERAVTETAEAEGAVETEQAAPAARLHKSSRDKKFAGVCGGIAEYLNADPTIIRLVFVLLVLGWGSGVLAYIACAVILPEGEAETDEEE